VFDAGDSLNLFKGYSVYTWLLVIFQVVNNTSDTVTYCTAM